MKFSITYILFFLLILGKSYSTPPLKSEVLEKMKNVVSWQINNLEIKDLQSLDSPKNSRSLSLTGWEAGTFWSGLMEYYKISADTIIFKKMCFYFDSCQWRMYPQPYDANSFAAAHAMIDAYAEIRDPKMISSVDYVMDMQFCRRPKEIDVHFANNKYLINYWSWCDALFMAPPAYVKYSKVTGDNRYMDEMDRLYKITYNYLYDKNEFLFYRDDTYFSKRSSNGQKIFWSRGNGWVIGGLVKILQAMDQDYPQREFYETLFKQMCEKLITIQRPEGHWSMSLLDPSVSGGTETSGTAFFCYAFAFGINNGLLNKDHYMPATMKAWNVLTQSLHPNGKMGYVQGVAGSPGDATYDDGAIYGSGAFLMAGSEVYKLLQD